MPRHTRRRFIATGLGAATIGTLAGCASDSAAIGASDDEAGAATDGGLNAQASFFVCGEFASAVAGDAATAATLVPVGQHGHGWEPGPQIQGTVLESDLFVLVREGFQPWADDLASNVRADGGDVEVVAAGAGIDLIEAGHHGDSADHGHEAPDGAHDDADGHDHPSGADPHFWLDPMRAKQAVANVRDAFVDADGANADAYAANAAAYRRRLDELDASFRSALDGASNSVVLVAGHDAFGYLGRRYGFEVKTLTGLSPDAQPTPRDIERAQSIIADHDLQYVCADPLASQKAASQLVAETDATDVLPLTPIPGQTRAWADRDWGYVEVMERINLETLRTALDAA